MYISPSHTQCPMETATTKSENELFLLPTLQTLLSLSLFTCFHLLLGFSNVCVCVFPYVCVIVIIYVSYMYYLHVSFMFL